MFFKIKLYEEIRPIISNSSEDIKNNYNNGIFLYGDIWDYFDIKDYFKIACINKLYNRISMDYFSKFERFNINPL